MKYMFICEECGSEVVYNTDMEKEVPRWVKCLTRGCVKKVYRNDIKDKREMKEE
jgi:hypothetical protein